MVAPGALWLRTRVNWDAMSIDAQRDRLVSVTQANVMEPLGLVKQASRLQVPPAMPMLDLMGRGVGQRLWHGMRRPDHCSMA